MNIKNRIPTTLQGLIERLRLGGGESIPDAGDGAMVSEEWDDVDVSGESSGPLDEAGLFLPPNTYANDFESFVPVIEDRFNRIVSVEKIDDRPFERDLHRIIEGSRQLKRDIETGLLELSNEVNFAYVISSMGTGYILWKLSDTQFTFGNTIDFLNGSHKTAPENLLQEPRNTIVTCVGASVMEPPVILADHLVTKVPFDEVLPKFAQMTGALLETDPGNRNFGYWTLGYRTIPIGGQDDMDLAPPILSALNQEPLLFSTEQWTPWNPDQEVQFAGRTNSFCIVPHDSELGLNGVEIIHADVTNVHVLKFRPLDPTWVNEEIRLGGMNYIDSEIRDESSLIHQVFRSQCKKYGKSDPIVAWEELRENYLDDHLPD